jgi:hypothetical protein
LEEEEEYYRQQEQLIHLEQEAAQQALINTGSDVVGKPTQLQQQQQQHKQAADEATKAAQEAAKAAAEASQGLMKGISSLGGNLMEQSGGFGFGFGGGSNKKGSSGFSLGGFGLGSMGGSAQPAKKPEVAKPKQAAAQAKQIVPQKATTVEVKPVYDDLFYKPCTAHMTAKERWWWAYRMTVQVKSRKQLQLLETFFIASY